MTTEEVNEEMIDEVGDGGCYCVDCLRRIADGDIVLFHYFGKCEECLDRKDKSVLEDYLHLY